MSTPRFTRNTVIPWLTWLAVLMLLSVGISVVLDQQRERLFASARNHINDEFLLIQSLILDGLQRDDYQIVKDILQKWGGKYSKVAELTLTGENGFILGQYLRPRPAAAPHRLTESISYSYASMATLEMTIDMEWVGKELAHMRQQLAIGVVAIGAVLWIIIWLAVRHQSETAALRGRTRELRQANDWLQTEKDEHQRTGASLRAILDNAAEGIITINEHGIVQSINRAAEKIFGYAPDEVIGRNVKMLIPSPEREAHDDHIADYLRTGVGKVIGIGREVTGQRKDGSLMPLDIAISEVHMGGERIFTGLVRDISVRKQALERLRRNEEQLRLTLENAPNGIATVVPDGSLLDVNPAFCRIMGYSADEAHQMSVADLTHPDDQEKVLQQYRKLWRGAAKTPRFEKRCIRRNGEVIDVAVNLWATRHAHSHSLLFVAEFEDITEHKTAAREVRHMRAYLKNIVNSMPSILVGVDGENRVTEWNTRAERVTGTLAREAIGQRFEEVLPEFRSQLEILRHAIERRKPEREGRLVTKKNGEIRYSDVVVFPLIANGNLGAVIRIDDVTDRVHLEQMMVQTEKMMSVGGLAAGMAHEINNPLSGVLQSCQNIQRRLSPDRPANRKVAESLELSTEGLRRYVEERHILEFVGDIHDAAARARQIVADMLAFSRRKTSPLKPESVSDMVERVVRLASSDYDLKKRYDFKKVEIVRDYGPGLGEVRCDRTEIEQVFLNLITNAAHAMASGAPPHRIILHTRREPSFARIEIEDNGPGMDEATQRRIFEPFFTTKPVGVGTGLGLSVSYFIITEQHKGTITVSTSPGNGARFVVRLPLERAIAS